MSFMSIFHIDLSRKAHEKFIVCGKKILHHLFIIIIVYVLITSRRRFSCCWYAWKCWNKIWYCHWYSTLGFAKRTFGIFLVGNRWVVIFDPISKLYHYLGMMSGTFLVPPPPPPTLQTVHQAKVNYYIKTYILWLFNTFQYIGYLYDSINHLGLLNWLYTIIIAEMQ